MVLISSTTVFILHTIINPIKDLWYEVQEPSYYGNWYTKNDIPPGMFFKIKLFNSFHLICLCAVSKSALIWAAWTSIHWRYLKHFQEHFGGLVRLTFLPHIRSIPLVITNPNQSQHSQQWPSHSCSHIITTPWSSLCLIQVTVFRNQSVAKVPQEEPRQENTQIHKLLVRTRRQTVQPESNIPSPSPCNCRYHQTPNTYRA